MGRIKSSVSRTLDSMIQDVCVTQQLLPTEREALAQSLRPISLAALLSMASHSQPLAEWTGAKQDVVSYLAQRLQEQSTRHTVAAKCAAAPTLVWHGLDVLGPKRKWSARDPGPQPAARITFVQQPPSQPPPQPPSDVQPAQQPRPEVQPTSQPEPQASPPAQPTVHDNLAALLGWSGHLTDDEAALRSRELLDLIHQLAEDKAMAEAKLNIYQMREAAERMVQGCTPHTARPQWVALLCRGGPPQS